MSINVVEVRLDVYLPGNNSTDPADADTTVDEADLELFTMDPRLQDLVDTGEAHIRNTAGEYTDEIRSGARVELYTRIGNEASLSRHWTGMVRTVSFNELGATDARMVLDLDDFVFGVMDTREVVGAFQERQVAGPSTAILNTLLARKAPEIDASQIDTFVEDESPVYNGQSLLDAAQELARRVNAVMWSDGTALRFEPLADITPEFTLSESDRGLASNTVNDDNLVNRLRVYGATDSKLENSRETFSSYTTVTTTTRLQQQVQTRKSEVSRVELYTGRVTGSTDDIVVRIHPNNPGGSGPVDVGDPDSDYARRRLSQEFISDGDWTTFLIPDHNLNNPNPWIIVEATGTDGQNVGVGTGGKLLYRQYFPYPTDLIKQNSDSLSRYRRREAGHLKRELTGRQQLSDYVKGVLNKTGLPDKEYQFPAESARTHELTPGDVVTVPSNPALNASGDHVVKVMSHRYDGSRLTTNVTMQDTETV